MAKMAVRAGDYERPNCQPPICFAPPRMPLVEKYKLTENLWHHVGPSSRKTLRVGPNAKIDDAVETVRDHIEQVVTNYKIPESLERRFNWLSAGDIHMKQELLNHILRMENTLAVEVIKSQLPCDVGAPKQHRRSTYSQISTSAQSGETRARNIGRQTRPGFEIGGAVCSCSCRFSIVEW